jgi:LacI family transcriptional regulator
MPFAFARGWECNVIGVNAADPLEPLGPVAGMIAQVSTPRILLQAEEAGVPVVNVSSSITAEGMPAVICDDVAVGRLGAEHFLRRGFRQFIFYAPLDRQFAKLRHGGFRSRLAENEFFCAMAADRASLASLLFAIPKPVAVMCCNDISALAVLEQCRVDHLKVPDQVAVLGVDNDDLIQSLASPPLSSVVTATEQIGFEAGALLERLMTGQSSSSHIMRISPTGIVTRQSTDLTAVADTDVAEALRFIREHAAGPIDIRQVLRSVTISRRQLERRFRSALGRSMLDEIRRCRVERARQLLLETDLTIPQIATASGFASASYLTVVFGHSVDETPGEFRKKFRRAGI